VKKDTLYKIKIAGFGGQGILYLGRFISELANRSGFNVTWLPSYGPEMRGGTANCSVIISSKEIPSPVIDKPDILIALNQPSFDKFYPQIEKDAYVIIDSSLVRTSKKKVNRIQATETAEKLGNKKVTNMVIAGKVLREIDLLDFNSVNEIFKESGFNKEIIKLNMKALKISGKIQ
jgi:2-oxoglutarate ferredoxin oxidoreductase subunit gamma